MQNKKITITILSLFVLSFLTINFVSANGNFGKFVDGVSEVVETAYNSGIEPIAQFLLGGKNLSGDLLLAKIFFFLILSGIIFLALKNVDFFKDSPRIHYIVTLAVAVLATKWIAPPEMIRTILLPYSTLGIAISVGLPFVIYFWIINKGMQGPEHSFIRKVAWILFAAIFTGLLYSRSDEISSIGWYIYTATIIGALIMAKMDGTIQNFFDNMEDKKSRHLKYLKKILDEQKEINELEEKKRMDGVSNNAKKGIDKLIKQHEEMIKYWKERQKGKTIK